MKRSFFLLLTLLTLATTVTLPAMGAEEETEPEPVPNPCYFAPSRDTEIEYGEINEIELDGSAVVRREGEEYIYAWNFMEDEIRIIPYGIWMKAIFENFMEGKCFETEAVLVPAQRHRWNRTFTVYQPGHPFIPDK